MCFTVMDRRARQATIHGVKKVGHDLTIKQQNSVKAGTIFPNPFETIRTVRLPENYLVQCMLFSKLQN